MAIKRIGDFTLIWGESLCWDDYLNRLYFVDCGTKQLHWLNDAEPPLCSMTLSSIPTGIGLVEDGRLLIVMDEGLNLIDPDNQSTELLAPYPKTIGRRANDATVDSEGNFITGSLKEPNAGSYWQFSSKDGWRQLADGISNANGPVVINKGNQQQLIFADTPARRLYSFDYDPMSGSANNRRVYADTSVLDGSPDGACATGDGDILSCLIKPGILAHYSNNGWVQNIDAGSEQPSDCTFGGPNLDRLFVVSINVEFGHGKPSSPLAGALVEIEGTGLKGIKENRFLL